MLAPPSARNAIEGAASCSDIGGFDGFTHQAREELFSAARTVNSRAPQASALATNCLYERVEGQYCRRHDEMTSPGDVLRKSRAIIASSSSALTPHKRVPT